MDVRAGEDSHDGVAHLDLPVKRERIDGDDLTSWNPTVRSLGGE